MRPSIPSTVVICQLFLICLVFVSGSASAASVAGDWTSQTPGKGWVMSTYGTTLDYDVSMHLDDDGNGDYSGTIYLDNKPYDAEGTLDGSNFYLTVYLDPPVVARDLKLTVGSGTLDGTDTFTGAVSETYTVTIHLKGGGGGGVASSGIPPILFALPPLLAIPFIALGSRKIQRPHGLPYPNRIKGSGKASFKMRRGQQYAPSKSEVSRTNSSPQPTGVFATEAGWPQPGGLPQEGRGAYYPELRDATGRPYPPRQYAGFPSTPACPIHGNIPCQVHYLHQRNDELGTWYCPVCERTKDPRSLVFVEGRGQIPGYPYGLYD